MTMTPTITRAYSIPIRPQTVVLGSLKNPILRALFRQGLNFQGFCSETDTGTRIDLFRLAPEAKPEQVNYACTTVQSWLDDVTFTTTRDSSTLFTGIPTSVFEKKIVYRGNGGDQERVDGAVGQRVYFKFSDDTGSLK